MWPFPVREFSLLIILDCFERIELRTFYESMLSEKTSFLVVRMVFLFFDTEIEVLRGFLSERRESRFLSKEDLGFF